jgi:exopolyphosphatase/pppGpp-phosphohydrolase
MCEITIADRGIREGILLDLMHSQRYTNNISGKSYKKNKKRGRFPFDRRKNANKGKK